MNAFYFKPPVRASKEREEVLLSSMLSMKVPEENEPGEGLSLGLAECGAGWEWCQDGRGQEAYPPQPIVSQTRAVLEAYARTGGSYREDAIEDCGHSPHVRRARPTTRSV